jgi:S1-C subfamily serine protease
MTVCRFVGYLGMCFQHPASYVYALTLLFAALALLMGSGRAAELNQESVVRVTSRAPEGGERTGTGFIVKVENDTLFILTAAHVVRGDDKPRIELFTKKNRNLTTEKRYEDDQLDAALLVLTGGEVRNLSALQLDTSELSKGEDVWIVGFPGGLSWDVRKLVNAGRFAAGAIG